MMFAALSIKEWTAIIVLATFALYIVIAAAGEDPASGGEHPRTAGVGANLFSAGASIVRSTAYWSMYSQAHTCCAAPALLWMGSRLISKSTGRPSTRLSNSSSDSRSVRWKK